MLCCVGLRRLHICPTPNLHVPGHSLLGRYVAPLNITIVSPLKKNKQKTPTTKTNPQQKAQQHTNCTVSIIIKLERHYWTNKLTNPDATSREQKWSLEQQSHYTLGALGNSWTHPRDCYSSWSESKKSEALNQAQTSCFFISLPLREIKCFRALKNHRKYKDVQTILKNKEKNVITKRKDARHLFKCSSLSSLSPSAKSLCSPPRAISSTGTTQINRNFKQFS